MLRLDHAPFDLTIELDIELAEVGLSEAEKQQLRGSLGLRRAIVVPEKAPATLLFDEVPEPVDDLGHELDKIVVRSHHPGSSRARSMLSPTTALCWSESNSASLHQTQGASYPQPSTLGNALIKSKPTIYTPPGPNEGRPTASTIFNLPNYRVIDAGRPARRGPAGGDRLDRPAGLSVLRRAGDEGPFPPVTAGPGRSRRWRSGGGAGQAAPAWSGAGLCPGHVRRGHRADPAIRTLDDPTAGPGRLCRDPFRPCSLRGGPGPRRLVVAGPGRPQRRRSGCSTSTTCGSGVWGSMSTATGQCAGSAPTRALGDGSSRG